MTGRWTMWIAAMVTLGCVGGEPTAGSQRLNLGACPDGLIPGSACAADGSVACETGDYLCWCESGEDGVGSVQCEEHGSALPPCTDEHAHLCAEYGMMETCRREDGAECGCELGGDGTAEMHCTDPTGSPPTDVGACTFDAIQTCLAGETIECTDDDGRSCQCYPTETGAEVFCVAAPAAEPCTDEHIAACLSGESVTCLYEDGRVCGCVLGDDGEVQISCEGDATPAEQCTGEHVAICEAGEMMRCFMGERRCWCDATSADGIACEATEPGPCTEEDIVRCAAGEIVECLDDGALCTCAPDSPTGFECEDTEIPPSGGCTMEDYAGCAAGEPVACRAPDGAPCICSAEGDLQCG
jgi:hypothetical protein